ncbi:MAG: tRNA (guanosine(37)-N1)-methyltransferase TrmD [Clostridiales bacterium]|jgi:tRNA (guanine37-N1)-methyltransferase|nr:tRNA (guanosine(37)-N1)-methyltransferase TrmD [Clostridiales bacterium]
MKKFDVLTIFTEQFELLKSSVIGKALKEKVFEVAVHDIRDYSLNKHKKCDDAPFGGGAGMVMTPQPIHDAILAVDSEHACRRIYMSPRGRVLDHETVKRLAEEERILILCGNYEGIDQRVIDLDIDEEISIGDYVLTGGELPALVLINAVSRYIPGVLGSMESLNEESFTDGLLEYPHYTRPQSFEGLSVPEVLVNGNHKEINKFRAERMIEITRKNRKDLYRKYLRKLKINEKKEIK